MKNILAALLANVLFVLLAAASVSAAGLVAAGANHSVLVKDDGTLWAWGDNKCGQLGIGTEGGIQKVSKQIGADSDWKAAAAGSCHAVGLKSDGSLWAWGGNGCGQLGGGTKEGRNVPVRIGPDNDWRTVAAGSWHVVALKKDGTLWAWGSNKTYQLGDGTQNERLRPTRIGTDSDWAAVAAGSEECSEKSGCGHSVALKKDGTLWAWGWNDTCQLGTGNRGDKETPTRIGTDSDWLAVAAGGNFSVALKVDGSLWTWGGWEEGRCRIQKPERVSAEVWKAVAAGNRHAAAVRKDGTLWTWGENGSGQLGDGTNDQRNAPGLIKISENKDWHTVAAGAGHTVAVKVNGEIWTWGSNAHGQLGLGDGQVGDSNIPKQVNEQNTPPQHSETNCPYPLGDCPLGHPPRIIVPPPGWHSWIACPYPLGGCPLGHPPVSPPDDHPPPQSMWHPENKCMSLYPCGDCPLGHPVYWTIECPPRE